MVGYVIRGDLATVAHDWANGNIGPDSICGRRKDSNSYAPYSSSRSSWVAGLPLKELETCETGISHVHHLGQLLIPLI